ncbi:MAG: MscL family protein, partial [Prevotella sp.]|nr:MscL family protein [Prevotella sp.]
IFFMIKAMNKLSRKKDPEPEAAPEPSNEEKLLTEIRDVLKNK